LHWKLFAATLLPVLAALALIGAYTSGAVRRLYFERATADLEVRTRLIEKLLPDSLPCAPSDELTRYVRELSRDAQARITVMNTVGRVTADSQEPHGSESVPYTPEVAEALRGRTGTAQRYSATSHRELLYVAVPLYRQGNLSGVLRTALPVADIRGSLHRVNLRIIAGGVLIALLTVILAFFYARRMSRPLEEMTRNAGRLATGDLAVRLDVPNSAELAGLADTLNHMAEELDIKIRTVTQQRNEQQAILASLREGVIALDNRERVLFVNRAAASLLALDPRRASGRLLQEVCRVSELHHFARSIVPGLPSPLESELRLTSPAPAILQVRGTELCDAAGTRIGVLLVLHDVTHVRRLENLRRDFVANVSHELKTPITSIQGFIETLREDPQAQPEAVREFLERIARNAERLNVIVEDLLTLSRIEREDELGLIQRAPHDLRPIAEAAVAAVNDKARAREIAIHLSAGEVVMASVNPTLLEQAIVNLLDNAVKYSEAGGTVHVEIARCGDEAAVHLRDQGCGIAAEHLPRLFERFYRVDMARSRRLGGTGLGLAIVKHIAQAHGGRVAVESAPGKGSTFSIFLPLASPVSS
jgi:two-component system phosphate regulon sensor histidine kinase PhoR